jgi:hypothetical protein
MTDRKVTESNYSARQPLDINHPVGAVVFLRMMSSLAWLDSTFIGKDAKFEPAFLSGAGLADVITKKFVHKLGVVGAGLATLAQAFADAFRTSALVSSVDGERSAASTLLHELFLGANWKGQREWIPLRNDLHRLRGLFEALPPSRRLIRFYCYFLAHTGSPTLPDTLIGIKEKLSMSQDPNLLDDDAIFYLEQILGRLISGGNIRIRSDAQLRTTTLEILDAMVTRGSSAAYKLRDDFLTPIPLGVS